MFKSVLKKVLGELRSGRIIALSMLITAAIAIAGPFNTYMAFTLGTRVIYWGQVVFVSIAISMVIRNTIITLLEDAPYWQRGGLLVLGMTLTLTPFLLVLNAIWLRKAGMEEPPFYQLAFNVALVSTMIATLRYVIEASHQPDSAVAPMATKTGERAASLPRLHDRLPEGTRGLIHRLSADNHFVLVHTPEGAHQLRMRFADAVAEMDAVVGHYAHRSHWVVASAVEGVEREGAKLFLRMVDGARVPVSRKYRPELELAGLIDL